MVKLIMGGKFKKKIMKRKWEEKKTHRKVVFVTPNGVLGDKSCR
jgi:hypothetical protein